MPFEIEMIEYDSRQLREAADAQHGVRAGVSSHAAPAWRELVEHLSGWVSWIPTQRDIFKAGWQAVKATQHELVAKHTYSEATQHGASTEWGKIGVAGFVWLVSGGYQANYAGQSIGRGHAPRHISSGKNCYQLPYCAIPRKKQRELVRSDQGLNFYLCCL